MKKSLWTFLRIALILVLLFFFSFLSPPSKVRSEEKNAPLVSITGQAEFGTNTNFTLLAKIATQIPTPTPVKCAEEGEVCYGFAGLPCCEGLVCVTEEMFPPPDKGGVCQPEIVVSDDENTISTYSPWVMHEPGWDRYVLFFNSMNNIDGNKTYKDRIYQMENYGDGLGEGGWINRMLVLAPEIDPRPGELGLIADPTVVWVGGIWHIYYTGTDDDGTHPETSTNNIFHATSIDRLSWTKHGMVTGLPAPEIGLYGNGEPSIIFENGNYRLFYFRATSSEVTVHLAESIDGQNFTDKGVVAAIRDAMNPDVRKEGNEYILTYSDFSNVYQSRSSDPYHFSSGVKLFSKESWYSGFLITPNYLPDEGRVYFAGTTQTDFPGHDTQIGVKYTFGTPTPTPPPSFFLSLGWNQITWPDVSGKKASDIPAECPIGVVKENFWFFPFVRNFGGVNFNFESGKSYFIKCSQTTIWSL